MSYAVDSTYDVYLEKLRRARKEHFCDACDTKILRGHRYCYVSIVWDGSARSVRRCLRCQTLHKHLRTLGGYDVWPDEELNCGLDYEEEWGDLPPEIAKLAFLTPEEIQALTPP